MDTEALNSDISVLKVCVLRQCMAIVNALRLILAIAKSEPSVFYCYERDTATNTGTRRAGVKGATSIPSSPWLG